MIMPWTPGPWEWDGSALKAGADDFILWPGNAPSEPEDTRQAMGACGLRAEPQANANAILIAHAPELARLLVRLNNAYEDDPAELKDLASEIRPMLKKIGAV